jgi:hypothetical protein
MGHWLLPLCHDYSPNKSGAEMSFWIIFVLWIAIYLGIQIYGGKKLHWFLLVLFTLFFITDALLILVKTGTDEKLWVAVRAGVNLYLMRDEWRKIKELSA